MEKLAMEFFKDKMENLLHFKLNWHLEQCLIEQGVIELTGDDFLCERITIVGETYCEILEKFTNNFGKGRYDFEISAFEIELYLGKKFLEHLDLIKKNIISNLRAFFGGYNFSLKDEEIKFILKK